MPRHWGKLKQGRGQVETNNLGTLYWTDINHFVKENSSKPIINQKMFTFLKSSRIFWSSWRKWCVYGVSKTKFPAKTEKKLFFVKFIIFYFTKVVHVINLRNVEKSIDIKLQKQKLFNLFHLFTTKFSQTDVPFFKGFFVITHKVSIGS